MFWTHWRTSELAVVTLESIFSAWEALSRTCSAEGRGSTQTAATLEGPRAAASRGGDGPGLAPRPSVCRCQDTIRCFGRPCPSVGPPVHRLPFARFIAKCQGTDTAVSLSRWAWRCPVPHPSILSISAGLWSRGGPSPSPQVFQSRPSAPGREEVTFGAWK